MKVWAILHKSKGYRLILTPYSSSAVLLMLALKQAVSNRTPNREWGVLFGSLKSLGRGKWQEDNFWRVSVPGVQSKFQLWWPESFVSKTYAKSPELKIWSGGIENRSVFRLQHRDNCIVKQRVNQEEEFVGNRIRPQTWFKCSETGLEGKERTNRPFKGTAPSFWSTSILMGRGVIQRIKAGAQETLAQDTHVDFRSR